MYRSCTSTGSRPSGYLRRGSSVLLAALLLAPTSVVEAQTSSAPYPDTLFIERLARDLSADSLRGRGSWTEENEHAARRISEELTALGAVPALGTELLWAFAYPSVHPDTSFNVLAVLPNRRGETSGPLLGITAHLDHLGVGPPDATGDSIHNGFLDAAVPVAMVLDVARRYAATPLDRPLVVLIMNLEEQGLLGARALVESEEAPYLFERMELIVGLDAGAPAGEAIEWQLMGGLRGDPEVEPRTHPAADIADSAARARGWSTTSTLPRPISDVYLFSLLDVPILFPIPGSSWRGYDAEERNAAMERFDHYHQPGDEHDPDFPWIGTWHYVDWIWEILRNSGR